MLSWRRISSLLKYKLCYALRWTLVEKCLSNCLASWTWHQISKRYLHIWLSKFYRVIFHYREITMLPVNIIARSWRHYAASISERPAKSNWKRGLTIVMRLSTPTYLVTLYLVLEMALAAQIDFHHPAAMPMDFGGIFPGSSLFRPSQQLHFHFH